MKRIGFWLALVALPLGACRTETVANAAVAAQAVPLTIRSAAGVHVFHVEVARTEAEQERGLMFRTSVAPDGGMIFPMIPPRIASFWMKNTVVPLDMIFIRGDGTIESIAAETVPYSLQPITSGEPVAAVLELAGGRAEQLGFAPGDKVSWPH